MIHLRDLQKTDAHEILSWMQDEKVTQFLNMSDEHKSLESINKFIESSQNKEVNSHFAIADEENNYCGTVSLKNINKRDKHAEFAIVMSSECNGKGYGNQAIKLIVEYAKNTLNLHKIYLNVLESNPIAIHVYEKNGFKLMGKYQDHIYRNDEYLTLLYYEKLL